jgi:hypothetical protein
MVEIRSDECLCDACIEALLEERGLSPIEAVRQYLEVTREEQARRLKHNGGNGHAALAVVPGVGVGDVCRIRVGGGTYQAKVVLVGPGVAELEYETAVAGVLRRVFRSLESLARAAP